ncbi:uncharacterized protein LOC144767330 [Lissotriton helveticus]
MDVGMRVQKGVQKGVKRAVKEVENVRVDLEPVLELDYGSERDDLEDGEVRDDLEGLGGAADDGDLGVLQAPAATKTKAKTAVVQVPAPRGRPKDRTETLTGEGAWWAAWDDGPRSGEGRKRTCRSVGVGEGSVREREKPSGGLPEDGEQVDGCVGGPGSKTVTWIVGHSFVHWASKYAERQVYGRNLGLKGHLHEVQWWGKGGMRWGALLPWLAKMVPQRGCPDLLIIHLGENDLVQLSGLALLQLMQRDLDVLKGRLAGTCIAWTELVPRKVWRGAMKHGAIERARRKLNRAMRLYCGDNDIKVIAHEGIRLAEPLVFRDDGVHLSQLGNAYYMMEMRDVVSKLWNEAIWCPRV